MIYREIFSVFTQVLFNAVLENATSEQGARMSAMDSSSRNAGDMLDRLTLTYNRSLSLSLSLSHAHTRILAHKHLHTLIHGIHTHRQFPATVPHTNTIACIGKMKLILMFTAISFSIMINLCLSDCLL